MHGRLKVRTSEEERERKKKEQALKVKAYKHGMGRIQEKRQQAEFDDEMLQLAAQILLRNPDLTTLWNIRRQCMECKAEALREDQPALQAVYDAELSLTEQCFMVNPKSYGAWHQRCWSLEHSPCANWQRELDLCTKYLKVDERNFHVWGYRRYVAGKAGAGKQQELDFCTEKIKVNFSNYSSWHYRSQLLPVLHPYVGFAPKRPMSETKLQEELELVLTAAFTDPNDSSAWFYQRWLLGYSRPEQAVCAFRCDARKAVLAFTNPIAGQQLKVLMCGASGVSQLEMPQWKAANGGNMDNTWLAALPADTKLDLAALIQLQVDAPTLSKQQLPLKAYAESCYYFSPPNRSFAYSPAVLTELQSQLESCNSLLEFEPDSKWTLLSAALLMRAIDRQKYHNQSLEYIEKLQQVDALREGYYKDLASKWVLEKLLTDWANSDDIPRKLDLKAEPQLNAICYAQYLSIADELLLSAKLQQRYGGVKRKLCSFAEWQV